jgi:hypothetical protein
MTIQQEFAAAARITERLLTNAHPEVSLVKLINRLSVLELETMRNEVVRVYVELIEQALQHVDPNGKNEGFERALEQIQKLDAIDAPDPSEAA